MRLPIVLSLNSLSRPDEQKFLSRARCFPEFHNGCNVSLLDVWRRVHASNLRRSTISCSAAASGISLSSSAVGPMENGFSSPGGDLRTSISFSFFFFPFHLPRPFISTRETPSGTHQPLTGAMPAPADLLSLDLSVIKPSAGGGGGGQRSRM